ncbi:MAG: hypothetical protein QM763_10440 [Agriterribacter sp.]
MAKRRSLFLILFFTGSNLLSVGQSHNNQVGIAISAPWVNNYRFYDYRKQTEFDKSGFMGLGAGAFYKNKNSKIIMSGSLSCDFMLPFGEPEYAPGGVRSHISAIAFDVTYHRSIFYKINLFAGGNHTNYWYRLNSDADSVNSYNKYDKTFGLTAGVEYQIVNQIAAAIIYRPAIVLLDRKQYWHVLSMSLRFELSFKK